MRDNEKHLVDVPLKQLSRVSHLIKNLREFHVSSVAVKKLASWTKLEAAILNVTNDGDDLGINAVMHAFGDLLSEAVWPE